jgi:transcriptional regulator with XRE-family HTH domain
MKNCTIDNSQMSAIYKQIGQNVKSAHKAKKISQLNLALAIGHKAVETVSMAELGINNKHFNIEHLVKIADVLEIDVCEFFKYEKIAKDREIKS